MRLTRNFTWDEMACPCCNECIMDVDFMYNLQKVRNDFGPMTVTSAYRCSKHNQKIGGSPNSQHKAGKAADIRVSDPNQKYKLVQIAMRNGFSNIGVYDRHVHIDTREGPVRMWAGVSK